MIGELKEVKYFKEIKCLKSHQKAEAYLEPKQASMMELSCEYTYRFTIFAIKTPSQIFDWVIGPPKIFKFSKWS